MRDALADRLASEVRLDSDGEESVVSDSVENDQTQQKGLFKRKKYHKIGEADKTHEVFNFEVNGEMLEMVKQSAIQQNLPLMEEYSFSQDKRNLPIPSLVLGPRTKLRSYQNEALGRMFATNRGRSGLIVLPCGAGKTLTGIAANCKIGRSCIVLCSSTVAVEQWIRSYLSFTNIDPQHIVKFTKDSKQPLNSDGLNILVTTYFMMSYSRKRSEESGRIVNQIKAQEWGLCLLDEVHVVPAKMFRRALIHVKAHCKLGLTATLVREDDLIDDLNFLIGPKLYEANWRSLTNMGFLARVICAEVWCKMTPLFYKEYLRERNQKRKQLLYVMNPMKFALTKLLMEYHEQQNDKILIFSDNIPALRRYGHKLKRYFMYGETPEREREMLLERFRMPANSKKTASMKNGYQFNDKMTPINTLIISQVGDVAIDLPEANIIIQISSHFGSRRQEAQRLGRILRPKSNSKFNVGYNAFFYSLLSQDTTEMFYSNKRQQYLVDQGYTFQVIRDLQKSLSESGKVVDLDLPTEREERELVGQLSTAMSRETEDLHQNVGDLGPSFARPKKSQNAKKQQNSLYRKMRRIK
eukprot:snap_masked-scaffold_3-processed-gene-13.25-mRNA-1 protein AED:0.03 eAED:0.03 QI:793/1/1/1/0.2/0.16/6/17/580